MKVRKNGLIGAITLLLLTACSTSNITDSSAGNTQSSTSSTPAEQVTLKLAAAASLEYAFEEKLIPLYEEQNSGVTVEGTYDSSGKLQTQIEEGLAADIFFSAAVKQMTALTAENLIAEDSVVALLENKVVLIVPSDDPAKVSSFADLTKVETVAIGDPESVPAGQYAKEVLTSLELWETLNDHFSLGTNVTQVLNWVAEGSTDAGIVYETDAKTTDKVKIIAEAPADSLAQAIIYPAGRLSDSQNAAAADDFLTFLQSEEAAAIFKEYGFTPIS